MYIPHFGGVELAQFGIAEENAVHFLVHLFEADLFARRPANGTTRRTA